jgi:Protein of unknown function (DUF2804)
MPLMRRGRPLKRWRYVGVYGPEVMLCVGAARVGVVPQSWWAIAEPGRELRERTVIGRGGVRLEPGRVSVRSGDVHVELSLDEGDGVEVASTSGLDGWIWTRKQANVPARGHVEVGGRRYEPSQAFVDESAGYHERHTVWRWSAGHGVSEAGEPVGWNLVTGVHDAASASERTVWVGGEPREVGPVDFARDLSRVSFAEGGALEFEECAARESNMNLGLLRSRYRQPFGEFRGELPGGVRLASGHGVMEEHDTWW